MKNIRGKLFMKNDNGKAICLIIEYPRSENSYYNYVHKQGEKHLYQTAISSKNMLDISEYFHNHGKYIISQINFLQEDSYFENLVTTVLRSNNSFEKIMKTINFLREENSIEIKDIALTSSGMGSYIEIKNNGIITVDEDHYETVVNIVGDLFNEKKLL